MSLVTRLSGGGQRKISAFFTSGGSSLRSAAGTGGGAAAGGGEQGGNTPSHAATSESLDNAAMPAKRKNAFTEAAGGDQAGPAPKRQATEKDVSATKPSSADVPAAEPAPLPADPQTPSGPKDPPKTSPPNNGPSGFAKSVSVERLVAGTQAEQLARQTSDLAVNLGASWCRALEAEFSKPYFVELSKFVAEERKKATVYPPATDVFAWTTVTRISEIKVVILGQDPYHGPGQAHGLCFSVAKGCPLPPSLENMYKELATDVKDFKAPGHGDLTGWAQQGVLLLNAVLTVRQREPNSHKDRGWEKFTDAVISWLNANTCGTVFILWGGYAQKKGAHINKKKHHVIMGVHPSPLSAHRGFFGGKNFSTCNKFLLQQGKSAIDWTRFV